MSTVTIEEAQAKLPELIQQLGAGEQLVITRNEQPIARLFAEPSPKHATPKAGSGKGKLIIVAEDEEHLEHFKEYMP